MKIFVVVMFLIMACVAEPPLSRSYLPPPPASRPSQNHSQGQNQTPGVASERNYGAGSQRALARQGFGRMNSQNDLRSQKYQQNSYDDDIANGNAYGRYKDDAAFRNDINEPGNYNFAYNVNDFDDGADFGHQESRVEERAEGEYHVALPDGRKQTVSYEADRRGFKPRVSYQEQDNLLEGYDFNANNFGANRNQNGGKRQGNGYGSGGNRHGNGYNNGYYGNGQNGY